MPGFLTPLSLAALLTVTAGALQAQTTETPSETEAPAADAPADPATDSGETAPGGAATQIEEVLDLGQEVGADGGVGQPYTKEEHGDWDLQCIRTEGETDPCQLYQLLKDSDGNSVAEVSMFRLPEGSKAVAGATVIVPLETLLTAQLTIAVDGNKGKRYPFAFCNPIGCYSRIGLTAEDVASFKRGAKATVSIVPFAAPDQTVNLDLSLKGFTAGYDVVSVIEAN